jgi:hypothetical protein
LLWNFGGPVVAFLILRWARLFPEELAASSRAWVGWPFVGAAIYLAARLGYVLGGPVPPELMPRITAGLNAALIAAVLLLVRRNARHAGPVGRRRVKWVLYGGAMGSLPLAVAQLLPLVAPDFDGFRALFAASILGIVAAPVGVLIAVVRYNLFDVDRLIGATAAYTLATVLLIATVFTVVPALSVSLASLMGANEQVIRLGLSVAAAMIFVPVARRLRPRVERFFFPERAALASGIDAVVADLPSAGSAERVLGRAGERLGALLHAERWCVYARFASDGPLLRIAMGGPAPTPPEQAPESLSLPLATRTVLLLGPDGNLAPGSRGPDAGVRDLLTTLGAAVAVPVRRAQTLAAVVLLGPKRSGDIYTPTDVSLLVAEA